MLVPVAVCVYIISAVIKKVLSVLAPIAKLLHVESVGGIAIVELAAILVVISACFLFGLMIRTTVLIRVGEPSDRLPGRRAFVRRSHGIHTRCSRCFCRSGSSG